jgi:hypothetical protein
MNELPNAIAEGDPNISAHLGSFEEGNFVPKIPLVSEASSHDLIVPASNPWSATILHRVSYGL